VPNPFFAGTCGKKRAPVSDTPLFWGGFKPQRGVRGKTCSQRVGPKPPKEFGKLRGILGPLKPGIVFPDIGPGLRLLKPGLGPQKGQLVPPTPLIREMVPQKCVKGRKNF